MDGAVAPQRRTPSARGLILTVVIAAMLFSSVYPLSRYVAVRNESQALEEEGRALEARIAELTAEADALMDPDEIEQIAREELGYVRPGEVPFVVVPRGDDTLKRVDPRAGSAKAPVAGDGWLDRWWRAVSAAARAVT